MRDSISWKSKREILRKYNASADIYDALYQEEQKAKIRSILELIQLGKSDLVLDAGCGTGLLFPYIVGYVGFLVGLDISKNLLKKASRKLEGSQNVTLILADADHMPFIDGSFDEVFAVTLLQNMPDAEMTLQEINRVAKRNAFAAVTGLKKTFRKEEFLALLNKAGLEVLNLKVGSNLLCYVAVCRKR